MKKLIYIIVAGFLLAACTSPKSDKAKVTAPKEEVKNASGDKYIVDVSASKIEWIGTKVSGYHEGTVKIKSGEVTVTNAMVKAGSFVIDMPTIIATGPAKVSAENSKKLTGHLRTSDFFDVEKFPEATFVITDVTPFSGTAKDREDPRQQKLNEYRVTDPTHRISGNLSIRGITKNIEFPARITVNNNVAEAKAKFNVNRKDWNIVYPGQPDDLIRDEIHLGIYLRATREGEPLTNK